MRRLLIYLLIISLFGPTIQAACIAHWRMNDDDATAVVTDSKSTHDGTFYDENTPATITSDHATTGQVNGGLDFDGTNDYITVADADVFSPALTAFSVAAWISLGYNGALEFLIVDKLETGKNEWGFSVTGDELRFIVLDPDNTSQIGRKDTSDYSAWEESGFIFVVATYDGGTANSGIKLYLNGVRGDDGDEDNDAGSFVTLRNNTSVLRIGNASGSPNYAIGVYDNIMIFNTELTQSQVETLYANGAGTENCDLVGSTLTTRPLDSDFRRSRY